MIKLDLKQTINFEDLEVGETFLVQTDDNEPWLGMKVAIVSGYEPQYYIMDLSQDVGELYSDWKHPDYKIIKLLDLKLTEE